MYIHPFIDKTPDIKYTSPCGALKTTKEMKDLNSIDDQLFIIYTKLWIKYDTINVWIMNSVLYIIV